MAEDISGDADKHFSNRFDYTRNYGETIGIFAAISYYAVQYPPIMICGALYYAVKYRIDMYQIKMQYSRPLFQYGRRARTTSRFLLLGMVIGQMGNVFFLLVVEPNVPVGVAMLMVFLVAFAIYVAYSAKRFRWRGKEYQLKIVKSSGKAKNKRLEVIKTKSEDYYRSQDAMSQDGESSDAKIGDLKNMKIGEQGSRDLDFDELPQVTSPPTRPPSSPNASTSSSPSPVAPIFGKKYIYHPPQPSELSLDVEIDKRLLAFHSLTRETEISYPNYEAESSTETDDVEAAVQGESEDSTEWGDLEVATGGAGNDSDV